jgi:two-component system sensor histidine kinase KdpD
LIAWSEQGMSSVREYIETVVVIGVDTAMGWFLVPNTGHLAIGLVYLLAVIVLSLRIGRRQVLFAGVLSALTWDYLIIPSHFSFVVQNFEDGMMLGT